MEHLIAAFLFKNNYCPLQELGTLVLKHKSAEQSVADKQITAPSTIIEFSKIDSNSEAFIEFVQQKNKCNKHEASAQFANFCSRLKHLKANEELIVNAVGSFKLNEDNFLQFNSAIVSDIFYPTIHVNRVVHPEATHQVRVGDNEKSNAYMQGYLKDSKVKKGNQWLMFFIIILLLIMTILIHYFTHLEEFSQGKKSTKPKSHTVESVR